MIGMSGFVLIAIMILVGKTNTAVDAVQDWSGMSRYGEDAPSYEKEDMYDHMKGFLAGHPLSELMQVLTDVVETIEWEKAENE